MDEDRLNVRYVSDINSIMPVAPRYNPDTRTYFKCSIYSPSNRLYTVNEEVNSTQSDVGGAAGDQFSSSSLLNSGMRKSYHRQKNFNQFLRNSGGSSIPFPERIIEEFTHYGSRKIEEEDIEDDTGNVSETATQPASNSLTPRKLIVEETKKINYGLSNPSTGGHTRTNSSKAQSLKGSIILQKPTNLSS